MASDVCFLCGKPGADTAEHIISRALYPPPRPDLLTSPSHGECNHSTSRDEEWLAYAWALTRPVPGMNQQRWDRAVRALRRERATKMRDAFLASFTDHDSGWSSMHVEIDRVYYVLAKIVKGLLFVEDRRLLLDEYTWSIRAIRLDQMVAQPFPCFVEIHDVAVFRWQWFGPSVCWALALFERAPLLGTAMVDSDRDAVVGLKPWLAEGARRLPWPRPPR